MSDNDLKYGYASPIPRPSGALGFVSTTPLHESGRTGVFVYNCKIYSIPPNPIKTQLEDTNDNPSSGELTYPSELCGDFSWESSVGYSGPIRISDPNNVDGLATAWDICFSFKKTICNGEEEGGANNEAPDPEGFGIGTGDGRFPDAISLGTESLIYVRCCGSPGPDGGYFEQGKIYEGFTSHLNTVDPVKYTYQGMVVNAPLNSLNQYFGCAATETTCEGGNTGGKIIGVKGEKWVGGKSRVKGRTASGVAQVKEYTIQLLGETNIVTATSLVPDVDIAVSNSFVRGIAKEGSSVNLSTVRTELFEVEFEDPNEDIDIINIGSSVFMETNGLIADIVNDGISTDICQNLCDSQIVDTNMLTYITEEIASEESKLKDLEDALAELQDEIKALDPLCDCASPTGDECIKLCTEQTETINAINAQQEVVDALKVQEKQLES